MVANKTRRTNLWEISDVDEDDETSTFEYPIHQCISTSSPSDNDNEQINDLLALSSLMSQQVTSDEFMSSESRLIRSKMQRLFHFLVNDVDNESMAQAPGDQIFNLEQVDEALINLNRNATLKFRNYKQLREQLLASTTLGNAENQRTNSRPSATSSSFQRYAWLPSDSAWKYRVHWLVHSAFFKWFISIVICLDAISVAITAEYSSPEDSHTLIHHIAVFVNRCILFIYLLELIFKWIDSFTNFWYSPVNILEFSLTAISLINLISELYIGTTGNPNAEVNRMFRIDDQKSTTTLQTIRSYGSILSLFRTLRMLRILRILEVAFRFTQVRIMFIALSRSVKLIFHVVLLTIIIIYFFALIALYLTQFGLNTTSHEHMRKINALFGTVPRAFITVFRLFTKDEWFEIKAEMYSLKINPFIIDVYVISWLFFGGYVLNPLLIGAMVGTFDETRKELMEGVQETITETDVSLNETNPRQKQASTAAFSSLLAQIDSIDDRSDRFDQWHHRMSEEIRLLAQDRLETQWPLYTAFYYLQLLEIYFENLVERQLLFDFFSICLLSLHDKETQSLNPPILSSSSSSSDGEEDH